PKQQSSPGRAPATFSLFCCVFPLDAPDLFGRGGPPIFARKRVSRDTERAALPLELKHESPSSFAFYLAMCRRAIRGRAGSRRTPCPIRLIAILTTDGDGLSVIDKLRDRKARPDVETNLRHGHQTVSGSRNPGGAPSSPGDAVASILQPCRTSRQVMRGWHRRKELASGRNSRGHQPSGCSPQPRASRTVPPSPSRCCTLAMLLLQQVCVAAD
uniref:PID domain-containing protein n=1 Tax=Macrostomum lignano TaxID=282301 RepID=A0A1I8FLQ0_9PLAT